MEITEYKILRKINDPLLTKYGWQVIFDYDVYKMPVLADLPFRGKRKPVKVKQMIYFSSKNIMKEFINSRKVAKQ